jgi:RNA polymerase sigma-70 factor (ECF subfamily)
MNDTTGGERGEKRCPDFARILRSSAPDATLAEQITDCFEQEMRQVTRHHCSSAAMADDAYQDALVRMLESLPSYRGEAPLQFWLRKLVLTACARLRRGRKNDPAFNVPLEALPEESGALSLDQQQEMERLVRERSEVLAVVLDETPEPNRSLLLLHEGQDVSLGELTERFDLTLDGVKSRLKRTRSLLRGRLLELAEEIV